MSMASRLLGTLFEDLSTESLYHVASKSRPVQGTVTVLHRGLEVIGLEEPYPDEDQLLATGFIMALTLILYYMFFGKRHRKRREIISRKLAEMERKVRELERQIDELDEHDEASKDNNKKPVRVWMDGCFDMAHYGHMNAFRQGRALGTELIVGVNSDESIKDCKGSLPVLCSAERCATVRGCKWVDQVVEGVPYIMTHDYLSMVMEKYKIDIVVHGDDPCIVDGKDVYQDAKDRGIFRSIPRTEGVSTTDIVGRMLYLSRDHHDKFGNEQPNLLRTKLRDNGQILSSRGSNMGETEESSRVNDRFIRPSRFLATSRVLRLFTSGCRDPPEGAKIVYIDGAWDMFHEGHVSILRKARKLGDYLIVGVHGDSVVNEKRGGNFPIMNIHERVLSVLGCRYTSDVLIDAPWVISRGMIANLKIDVVCCGSVSDHDHERGTRKHELDYAVPLHMGILKPLVSDSCLTVGGIIDRILDKEKLLKRKVANKMQAESQYYSKRYGYDVAQEDTQ